MWCLKCGYGSPEMTVTLVKSKKKIGKALYRCPQCSCLRFTKVNPFPRSADDIAGDAMISQGDRVTLEDIAGLVLTSL